LLYKIYIKRNLSIRRVAGLPGALLRNRMPGNGAVLAPFRNRLRWHAGSGSILHYSQSLLGGVSSMLKKKHISRRAPISRKRSLARTRAWNSRSTSFPLWKRRWMEKH